MGPMGRFGALWIHWGDALGALGPIRGGASALEAEGRLNGGLGAKHLGIWGPHGPFWGALAAIPFGGSIVLLVDGGYKDLLQACC